MAKLAMWTPGTSTFPGKIGLGQLENVSVDSPPHVLQYTDLVGFRSGSFTRFRMKPNQRHNFHIPIPTPVIVPVPRLDARGNIELRDVRSQIEKVILMFSTLSSTSATVIPARLRHVQVNDGASSPILNRGGLDITGNFSGGIDSNNSWEIPGHPLVYYGISLSVTFESFRDASDIVFYSAGADFIVT